MRPTLIALALLICKLLNAQAPALIPYQAIARNAAGEPLASNTINARFTIHDVTATGASVWQEMQTVSTSALGLFTAQLGSSVSLANVNWAGGAKFMQVEIDLGNGFIDMGTQQMLSVPYAFFSDGSQHAETAGIAQLAGNGILNVSISGDTLWLNNGNFLIIPGISSANAIPIIYGCMDDTACNYYSGAEVDDGSCYFVGGACYDYNVFTTNDVWNSNCVCEGGEGDPATEHTCGATAVHNPNLNYGTMTDQQGNVYKTIVIGTQEWMAENLNTSIYRNGDAIPTNLTDESWYSTINGAWTHYNNDVSYACPYGKLYNWYTCVDPRQLCPSGWHVPTVEDWTQLTDYLGGESVAGGKMKSIGSVQSGNGFWNTPNTGATNSSGFSAVAAGQHYQYSGAIDSYTAWWSSSDYLMDMPLLLLNYNTQEAYSFTDNPGLGLSVRCLRD